MILILALFASLQAPCVGPNVVHSNLIQATPGWAFLVVHQDRVCEKTPDLVIVDLLAPRDPWAEPTPVSNEVAEKWVGPLRDDDPYSDESEDDDHTIVFDPWASVSI